MIIRKYGLEQEENVPYLVKEKEFIWSEKKSFNSPLEISNVFNLLFRLNKKTEEYVYMVCMNTKCVPVGVFEVSHGNVQNSIISPRETMQRAIMCGASSFVLIHNHPSGDTTPSLDDMRTAKQIKEAGKLMNIELLDFIIVAGSDYYSFDENLLPGFDLN